MNYQALQEAIATAIKTNGEGEITGAVLQSVLQSMVSIVGANYQYMGVATTSTNPGTPAGSVFYLTSTAGTYTNFNNIVVEDGKLTALMWDSTAWSKSEIADLGGGGGNVDYDVISGANVQLKNEEATPIYPKTNIPMVEGLSECLDKIADRDTIIYTAEDCLGIRDAKWDSRYTAYYVIVRKGDVVKVTPQAGVVNGSIAFVTISSLENTSAGASVTFANGTTSAPINVHRNDGEKTFDIIEDCVLVVYTKYTAQCTPTLVKINGMPFQTFDGTTITFEDITWNDYDEMWRTKITQNENSIEAINEIIGGSSANEVDVIMFSGQSNAAGRGVVNSSYPQDAPACPTSHGYEFRAIRASGDTDYLVPIVKTFGVDQNKAGGISDTNGTGTPSKTGGLVPSFVNAYFDISKTPIIGVSASKGGTGIATFAGSAFINDMKQRMTDCLTYLSDNNYVVKNKYFVWWQGENDAYNTQTQTGMTKEEYKTFFLTMWTALKTVGFEVAMIIDVHRPKPGTTEASTYDTDDIATAQFELAKENEDIIIITTKPSAIPDTMKDGWHFTQYGYNLVGQASGYHAGVWQRNRITQPLYNIVDENLFFDNKVN